MIPEQLRSVFGGRRAELYKNIVVGEISFKEFSLIVFYSLALIFLEVPREGPARELAFTLPQNEGNGQDPELIHRNVNTSPIAPCRRITVERGQEHGVEVQGMYILTFKFLKMDIKNWFLTPL